jgi:hypothetical protein
MAVVSRLQLDHPALGTPGGASLHAQIQAIYEKIGNNMADRFFVIEDLDDSDFVDLEHNFNTAFADLRYDLYEIDIGTGELTQRITNSTTPSISSFSVIATPSFEKLRVRLSNASGITRNLALVLLHDPIDIDEVKTPATNLGDFLVYDGANFLAQSVGVDGQVLISDSSSPTGLAFADGGAGGAGEINAIVNPSAASDTSSWTAGADHTITRLTSGSPLDPIVGTAFRFAGSASTAESSTSGVRQNFDVPVSLQNKKLKAEFHVAIPSSDVWRVSLYQGTTRLPLSTDASGATTLPAGFVGKFTTYFDSANVAAHSLHFTKTTHSGAADLDVTNIIVGPGIQPQGAVVSETEKWTPTGNWVTNVAYNGNRTRIGNLLKAQVIIDISSTGPNAAACTINMPAGLTIDTAKLPSPFASGDVVVGSWAAFDSSAVQTFNGTVQYSGSGSSVTLLFAGTTNVVVTETLPATWEAGDKIACYFTVPIAEWSGSGVLNTAQNDVEYLSNSGVGDSDNTTSFSYDQNGSPFSNITATRVKRVRALTPSQAGDDWALELSSNGGISWYGATENNEVFAFQTQNTNSYGWYLSRVVGSNTDVDVVFAPYRLASGATFGAAGLDWSALASDTNYRWRVVKRKKGVAVGFGLATAQESGLLKAGAVPGITDGSAAASGNVGQVINIQPTTNGNVTNAFDTNFDAWTAGTNELTLPAGRWRVTYQAGMEITSSSSPNLVAGSVHLFNVTDSVDIPRSYSAVALWFVTNNQQAQTLFNTVYLNLTSSKTYRLRIRCNQGTDGSVRLLGNSSVSGTGNLSQTNIFAERIG